VAEANHGPEPVSILLVEDDPGDVRLIREMLTELQAGSFSLTVADTIETAIATMASERPEVILLDLCLPDSRGLDTFMQIRDRTADIPIVVLTGVSQWDTGIAAVQKGAQDYLVKGQVDGQLLRRSIHYAVERYRLIIELEHSREREERLRELRSLDRLAGRPPDDCDGKPWAEAVLRSALPRKFVSLTENLGGLLETALEEDIHKSERKVPGEIRSMAEEIGRLGGGPRDVVDIYYTAIRERMEVSDAGKAKAYVREGRLVLLELLGYLASYYRTLSLGIVTDPRGVIRGYREAPPEPAGGRTGRIEGG